MPRVKCHMLNKKVYIFQEIIPSYRVPIFRRLGSLDGVDLTVFYSRPSKAMSRENLKNAKVIEGFRNVRIGQVEIGACNYQFGMIWRALMGSPDVVISGKPSSLDGLLLLVLCKILKVRVLWFLGGVPYMDESKIKEYANQGKLNRWLGKYNPKRMLRADGIIAYTEHAKRYYVAAGFREKDIWVASNSPDTDALHDYREEWLEHRDELATLRGRFSPQGEKIIFLMGRLNNDRKVDVLLGALSELKKKGFSPALVIVGDGSERVRLTDLAVRLGLTSVFFEGAIYDEKELTKYFLISDIFVTPGVSSLAIKMAMYFGKPVVTVDYGLEVHDVQDGVNGLIFPMDNVGELAGKIELLLQSEQLAMQIGANGMATMRDRINIGCMVEGFRKAIFSG